MKIRAVAAMIGMGWSAVAATSPLGAQQSDSAAAPRASFAGRVASALDSRPIRSAEIRLLFIDSTRTNRAEKNADSLDIFVDTARSRVAVTDTSGQFILRRLPAGSYLMQIRRIGFQPIEGALTVDTGLVRANFAMQVTSVLLSKVMSQSHLST